MIAELVAGTQLGLAGNAAKALDMIDGVVSAHDVLVGENGFGARLAVAAHTPRAEQLQVVLAAQDHRVAREALLAEVRQDRLAYVTLQALCVPVAVQALQQVPISNRHITSGARSNHILLL